MGSNKYITDKKAFSTALFEEAFGKTVNEKYFGVTPSEFVKKSHIL